jgi:hypothetical protein
VNNDGEQEEESSHQRKNINQKKKNIGGSIQNIRAMRTMEGKMRAVIWVEGQKRKGRTRWGGGWRWGRWCSGKDGAWRRINRHRGWCVKKQEKGYALHREGQGGGTRVEGTRLIKSDITRNAHPTANGVPTPITLVLIAVAKKHTLNSS